MISIGDAVAEDIPGLYALYAHIGKKDDGYFEKAMEQADILLAHEGDTLCAFCVLNWKPRYSLYRKLGIPEIQDINVLPDFRRRGIATSLIKECESRAAAKKCETMGISVGLTKDYGPAQILYARLGYMPDGNGVTYDREGVHVGRTYPMDDDLSLMLLRDL